MNARHLVALISALAIVICFGISAQTVTVDASNGSPDNVTTFNSLQAALASFGTAASTGGPGANAGNAAPNVINVVAATPLVEPVNVDALAAAGRPELQVMDGDITINGVGGQAILAGQATAGAAFGGGFFWRQDVNITVNDFIWIPGETPLLRLAYFRQANTTANVTVNLNNCVLTSNDGTNHPVTLTGQDNPDLSAPGVITCGLDNDGLYLVSNSGGGSLTANLTDVVISSYTDSGNGDGIIMFATPTAPNVINCDVTLGPGCVISNTSRFGIQNPYGGRLHISGSPSSRVVLNNIHSDGIWNFSDTAPGRVTVCDVNNAVINGCTGTAIKEQETNGNGFINTVRNTIISNCGDSGIGLYASGTPPIGASAEVTVDHVTVHNCGNPTPVVDSVNGFSYDDNSGQVAAPTYTQFAPATPGTWNSNRNVRIVDTILSGNTAGLSGLYNSGTGTMNIGNSAIVTAGGNALTTATGGAGTINQSAVINSAVVYKNTTDPFSPDYFDVVVIVGDGSPYRTAGSGGGPLTGGAHLYEFSQTGVGAWNLYR